MKSTLGSMKVCTLSVQQGSDQQEPYPLWNDLVVLLICRNLIVCLFAMFHLALRESNVILSDIQNITEKQLPGRSLDTHTQIVLSDGRQFVRG